MRTEDRILNFLQYNGPSLPIRIAKNIKEEVLITSAFLSELVSQRKVRISKLKIGTSPLYFIPGQEDQLVNFTDGLNKKDHGVLMILRDKKILQESTLDLLAKVALRSLKDFAKPVQVSFNGKKELFWKWHTLGDSETNQILSQLLNGTNAPPPPEPATPIEGTPPNHPIEQTNTVTQTHTSTYQTVATPLSNASSEVSSVNSYPPNTTQPERNYGQEQYPPNTTNLNQERQEELRTYPPNTIRQEQVPNQTIAQPEPQRAQVEVAQPINHQTTSLATETKIVEDIKIENNQIQTETKVEPEVKPEILVKEKEIKKEVSKPVVSETKKEEPSLVSKIKNKITKKKKPAGEFLPVLERYFIDLDIDIESHEVVRKNSELNFVIKVPSVVGRLSYFCKAKSKNRCDEKDISAAYMEAQMKKRPLLFLYTGDLSKKAKEMLELDAFDNAVIKKIEDGA